MASHFADNDHDVSVVTMTSTEGDFYPLDPRVRRISLDLAGTNKGLGKLIANCRRWRALRSALVIERPDVLVAIMTTSVVRAILAAIGLSVRVYGSERNYPGGRNATAGVWALMRRLVYRFAYGHIAQTRESAVWLEHHTDARNVNVIPNPVVWPIPVLRPEVSPTRVVSPQRKVLLAVGSKPEQKGFDLLLRAFARLAGDWPDWDLVIIGVDPASSSVSGNGSSLRRLAEEQGIALRVHLPGRVGNVADWYARSDLFVLSSRYEGFPNVLLEAMAAGCACVAFDCDTGPRDMIEPGVNGVLVPAEDIMALREKLSELMGDESQRERLANEAIHVRERFNQERVMGRWAEVLGRSGD